MMFSRSHEAMALAAATHDRGDLPSFREGDMLVSGMIVVFL
jgi:hypothetical protein